MLNISKLRRGLIAALATAAVAVGMVAVTAAPASAADTAVIGDRVWYDISQNGIQNTGEPGIPDVTVTLYAADGTTTLRTTTTSATGLYRFDALPAGTYVVGFTLPAWMKFSPFRAPGSNLFNDSDADPLTGLTPPVTMSEGLSNLTVDAGMYVPNGFLEVDKTIEDPDGLFATAPSFDFTWTSEHSEAPFPITNGGSISVAAGSSAMIDTVEWGSQLTLAEDSSTLPALPAGYTWNPPQYPDGNITQVTCATAECAAASPLRVVNSYTAPTVEPTGGFQVTKVVNSQSAEIPDGLTYPLVYSVNGASVTVQLVPGEPFVVTGLSPDDFVTLQEGALPVVDGVTWQEPSFTMLGVDAGSAVSFNPAPEQTLDITLTNTAEGAPPAPGSFTITKTVQAAGVTVPGDTQYAVIYSVDGGDPVPMSVTAGSPVTVPNIPAGSVITLSESTPPALAGVAWAEPSFSVDGVHTGSTSTFTAVAGHDSAVILTNTASASSVVTPPTSSPTPTPTPSPSGTAEPGPAGNGSATLAITGGSIPWLAGAVGIVLIAGGLTALLALRRRRA